MIADRVKETTTTTGTGDITLAGAETGFDGFVDALGADELCYYAIQHRTSDEWEVGLGLISTGPDVLERVRVLSSSNNNDLVNLSLGTKDVFVTTPACKIKGATLRYKDNVVAATTANITLAGEQTIDGVAVLTGDRVLVKDQTDPHDNGIYIVSSGSSTWERACDLKLGDISSGSIVYVEQGTVNAETIFAATPYSPLDIVGDYALYFYVFAAKNSTKFVGTSPVDNAIARWDGTTGLKLQNSPATMDDEGKAKIPTLWADISSPSTSGSTITLDGAGASGGSSGNRFEVTLPSSTKTLAVSNMKRGQVFMLRIVQDGTGSRTVTWFSTIKWPGGSAPTLTTTANKADMFIFVCTSDNTNFDGFTVGQNL